MLTDPVKKTKGNTKAIKIASDCGNSQEQEPVEHHDWALAGEEGGHDVSSYYNHSF